MKYKSPGITKNKKIQEQRKHPLPTLLMARIPDDEIRRTWVDEGGDRKNKVVGENV